MSVLNGRQPDLTPAQLVSSVPVLAGLAAAAGAWDPSAEQSRILRGAMLWSAALVVADALLRVGRGAAGRPPMFAPPAADLLSHPDAAASPLVGPSVEPGEEEEVVDAATESYGEDDLEPLPAGDDDEWIGLAETEIDPELTRSGEVGEEAGKPADFR